MVVLAPPTTGSANVLRIYRHMLKAAARLPRPQEREDALKQVREGFRANAREPDQARIGALLTQAQSRLSFLRIVTPRDARAIGEESASGGGVSRVVYQDGKGIDASEVKRGRKPISNWTGNNLDPDSVSRHKRGLSRAGFRDHGHVIGPQGF